MGWLIIGPDVWGTSPAEALAASGVEATPAALVKFLADRRGDVGYQFMPVAIFRTTVRCSESLRSRRPAPCASGYWQLFRLWPFWRRWSP